MKDFVIPCFKQLYIFYPHFLLREVCLILLLPLILSDAMVNEHFWDEIDDDAQEAVHLMDWEKSGELSFAWYITRFVLADIYLYINRLFS